MRLDILKRKSRRASDSSLVDRLSFSERRNSLSNPMIVISETNTIKRSPSLSHVTLDDAQDIQATRRLRANSLSIMSQTRSRSRSASRPVTKKRAKELIKQETSIVALKKLHLLLHEMGLQDPIPIDLYKSSSSGSKSSTASIYVANSSNCIYLPPATSASFTYEDVDNGGIPEGRSGSVTGDQTLSEELTLLERETSEAAPPVYSSNVPPHLLQFKSPNFLCTKIDSDIPIPHTFAVIIDLNKPTNVRDLKFVFQSCTSILWPTGEIGTKGHSKEKFKIGMLEWNTSLGEADFFANRFNSNDTRCGDTSPELLAERTRQYKLASISNTDTSELQTDDASSAHNNDTIYPEGLYVFLLPILLPEHIPPSITTINGSLEHTLSVLFSKTSDKLNRKVKLQAAYNIPMVRTPPSLANSVSNKPIFVDRVWNDSLHYTITFPRKYVPLGSEHPINIKLIPLVKDVVVKRIKFNILERITYVSQSMAREYDYDGEDPFQLHQGTDNKTRERIVSVCELKTKSKANTTSLVPYKEELIKCPDNNLLFSCYEPELSDSRVENYSDNIENFRVNAMRLNTSIGDDTTRSTMIASPLDINIALPFLTTKADKNNIVERPVEYKNHQTRPSHTPNTSRRASLNIQSNDHGIIYSPASPTIGTLETNISHSHADHGYLSDEDPDFITPDYSTFLNSQSSKQNLKHGYTSVPRALYPDSNFRHIQVHHRLQICFRISKPDDTVESKMHHYEVVVDTPLVLMSSQCNEDAIQLPTYDASGSHEQPEVSFNEPDYQGNGVTISKYDPLAPDTLPSFEEAVSAPTSPLMRSASIEEPLSSIPSISPLGPAPLGPAPAYENVSSTSVDSVFGQLSIDDVVQHDSSNLAMRQSTIRSSLSSSFATPSHRPADHDHQQESELGRDNETVATSSSLTTADSSEGTPSSQSKSSLESSLEIGNRKSDSYPHSDSTGVSTVDAVLMEDPLTLSKLNELDGVDEPEHNDSVSEINASSDGLVSEVNASSDDLVSVVTQPFEQRIPLLRNVSVDGYNLSNVATNSSFRSHEPRMRREPSEASIMTHPVKHEMHHAI